MEGGKMLNPKGNPWSECVLSTSACPLPCQCIASLCSAQLAEEKTISSEKFFAKTTSDSPLTLQVLDGKGYGNQGDFHQSFQIYAHDKPINTKLFHLINMYFSIYVSKQYFGTVWEHMLETIQLSFVAVLYRNRGLRHVRHLAGDLYQRR